MNYGRYKIVQELGRGAMGVVYQAHDPQIDRLIALKVLRQDRVTSDDFVKRFLKEAKAIGRLSHPGIVTVYDIGQDHGTIYIAMEYLDGTALDGVMAGQKFSPEEIVDIGSQVASALDYAHQKGIIHRDIKPPNIICTSNGTVKVTDFGIARIEDAAGQQQTKAGEILGTPLYMSPEQVSGMTVDGRSDIYSLGLILYELATGTRPFKGSNLTTIFKAITQDIPQPVLELSQDIPAELSSTIMQCLDKEPGNRYPSGEKLTKALTRSLPSSPQRSQLKNDSKSQTSNLMPLLLILFSLIGLGIGVLVYYTTNSHNQLIKPFSSPEKTNIKKDIISHQQVSSAEAEKKPVKTKPDITPDNQPAPKITKQSITRLEPKAKKKTISQSKQAPQTTTKETSSIAIITRDPDQNLTHPQEQDVVQEVKIKQEEKSNSKNVLDFLFSTISGNKKEAGKQKENATIQKQTPQTSAHEKPAFELIPPDSGLDLTEHDNETSFSVIESNEELQNKDVKVDLLYTSPQKPPKERTLPEDNLTLQDKPIQIAAPEKSAFELIPHKSEQDLTQTDKNDLSSNSSNVLPLDLLPENVEEKNIEIIKFTTLRLKSRPEGAKLFINGDFKGNTPMDLKLPADKYEVQLRLKDHENWEAQLDLSGGGIFPHSQRMFPKD